MRGRREERKDDRQSAGIITSPAFTGERILGSILFEMTMDRQIPGQGCRGVPVAGEARRALPQGRQGTG